MHIGLGLGITSRLRSGVFNLTALFSSGEPGFASIPKPSICFTDLAGTTQAGAGQAVALRLDESGNDNHATQSTTAARPILGREPASGARNLLLNTDSLSTQTRTVRAVEHVLSFFGTGTVTLSGASTAGPLVGTGENDRVHISFTPTAGSLTLTVSGSVNFAQLEEA
jgi:hypothetical protein